MEHRPYAPLPASQVEQVAVRRFITMSLLLRWPKGKVGLLNRVPKREDFTLSSSSEEWLSGRQVHDT